MSAGEEVQNYVRVNTKPLNQILAFPLNDCPSLEGQQYFLNSCKLVQRQECKSLGITLEKSFMMSIFTVYFLKYNSLLNNEQLGCHIFQWLVCCNQTFTQGKGTFRIIDVWIWMAFVCIENTLNGQQSINFASPNVLRVSLTTSQPC